MVSEEMYNTVVDKCKSIINDRKKHGEAWREMSFDSILDLVKMKIYRVRSSKDPTELEDAINYLIFAHIMLDEITWTTIRKKNNGPTTVSEHTHIPAAGSYMGPIEPLLKKNKGKKCELCRTSGPGQNGCLCE